MLNVCDTLQLLHACKHILLDSLVMLYTGEEDDFIREAAIDSVRVHPLSLCRCKQSS